MTSGCKRFLCALLCLGAMLLCGAGASAGAYTYTVRIFAGTQGTFDGKDALVYEGLSYGDRVSFRLSDVTLLNGDKYYVKGIRESGKDNNTVDTTSFIVTRDQDYVVAYGIRGAGVAYTIRYVDENGRELAPSETYYGNIGDKPVLAYLLIDGYRPRYYNVTGTLSESEADNEFVFVYAAIPMPTAAPTQSAAPASTQQSVPGAVRLPAIPDSGDGTASETPVPAEAEGTDSPDTDAESASVPGTAYTPVPAADERQGLEDEEPKELYDRDEDESGGDGGEAGGSDVTSEPGGPAGTSAALIAAGSLAALLLVIWLFVLRRRKSDKEQSEDQGGAR